MRKIVLATTLTLMCGSAFAQGSTGPAPQGDNVQKPGLTNSGQTNGSMKNTTGSSMSKDGMNKPAGGESKDGQGMNKGGAMSK
jgi:hypothetical protein